MKTHLKIGSIFIDAIKSPYVHIIGVRVHYNVYCQDTPCRIKLRDFSVGVTLS